MTQNPKDGFIGAIPEGQANFIGGAGHTVGQDRFHTTLKVENRCRCLLAGFHAGLVVGVDVHQFAVETDGTLEQSDQGAETAGIKAAHADRHALAATLGKG